MLFKETVAANTLELLESLMAIPELSDFALVGGTNLALRFGHRISVDLDLFSNKPFDSNDIVPVLLSYYPSLLIKSQRKSSLQCWVNEIKVDIVLHEYPYLQPVDIISGLRLASTSDIVAMKLNALSQRGAKKDFWDIAELLDEYSLEEMLQFFSGKYKMYEVFHIVRSLSYFEDADNMPEGSVIPLKKVTWLAVKNKIQVAIKEYLDSI
jgi:Nucleotidyl transferase AbiEii toxin, Type IV TA system